ncbi:MAG TPA: hypothetical protein VHN80_26180, partial [Kineosporiaceae bacterium]|nr:hypothetical protein [Kineosporiaceae bacterium]
MRRWIFLTLAASVAVLPAVFGIAGNATLSQSVPALVPAGAVVLPTPTPDDHGGRPTTTTATTAHRATGDDLRHHAGIGSSTTDDRVSGRGGSTADGSATETHRSSSGTHRAATPDDHG